ncbi:PHD and RING finger domain-containing protein 1-like isoform X2 [Cynoglossus semilaevis]|uniref:PHD and RING finger domain-containing protein 1-like isoform X2 n=1 Tax=Cynoglossus semilaevis TaxID=244447 RepID=UPI0007DC844D|nr:PHD and RING finger domain-containing protein 1-like isoform X2 [Cynoglossus semilaevis]
MECSSSVLDKADRCYICLSLFKDQSVGSLPNCRHFFCFECILQWSQTANTCPVDRTSFDFIHQRQRPGGAIQNKIKVQSKKEETEVEEPTGGAVHCDECGRSDRRRQMLVCIHCDSGYHMNCLTPSLSSAPEGDWICSDCLAHPPHTDDSMLEADISDGEVTDLLSDFDGPALITNRLRVSTTNRPSSSTGRRRSTRLRSGTSADSSPRTPTTWHVPRYLMRASRSAVRDDDVTTINQSDSSSASN